MKNLKLCLFFLCLFSQLCAQKVPLNSIVEHFTNTKCSVCASRNPGFITNKSRFPSLSYISIHPSSPYSSCILSQQNTTTNDARTNFYSVFGSTPRIILNGSVVSSSSDYADTNLLKPYLNLMSSFSIKMKIMRTKQDSMTYQITVTKRDTSSVDTAILFSGNIEDTLFVNGGNGEPLHYNVLRYGVQEKIKLPAIVSDSIVIAKSLKLNAIWDEKRISSFAILQANNTKQLIQTGKSNLLLKFVVNTSQIEDKNQKPSISIYPNPATSFLTINSVHNLKSNFTIYTISGELKLKGSLNLRSQIDIESLPAGTYIIHLENDFLRFEIKK
jgi:hypothetical protein